MDKEQRQDLERVIRGGSQKRLQRVKKDELLELLRETWAEQEESQKNLEKELDDARTSKQISQEIIDSNGRLEQTLEEYRELLEEVKNKYTDTLRDKQRLESTVRVLVGHSKSLKWSMIGLVILEILTIIIGVII